MNGIIVCLLAVLVANTWAVEMSIEGETRRGSTPVYYRGAASGGKTTYLHRGEGILMFFCLTDKASVSIKSVVYSNNGGGDDVTVTLDGARAGTFRTDVGSDWNLFKGSGQIGSLLVMAGGVHDVEVTVTDSDEYGVEIDKIVLEVSDPYLHQDSRSFTCQLPCVSGVELLRSQARGDVADGYMKQYSDATKCAEEDNVNIAMFHSSVKEFTVTATMPRYHSFSNVRTSDTANCPFLIPEYWIFQDVHVDELLQMPAKTGDVSLSHSDVNIGETATHLQFEVIFKLDGRSTGRIDSEIGSILKLTLIGLTENADVTILYRGRATQYSKGAAVNFTESSPTHQWNIPDFTWIEKNANEIILQIITHQKNNIVIGTFSLERRAMLPETVFPIMKSEKISIEGIDVDFWWRAPDSMNVELSTTSETWSNVDYFRVAVRVPWTMGSWSQVFVMYQDGNIRLLPIVPPGVDWIPFGTSVIVGQTVTADFRPVAPISRVVIDPETLTLDLTYRDGGRAKIQITSYLDKTTIQVRDIEFRQSLSKHPFATFRSMFVASGNDDADSAMTDKEGPTHVMKKWNRMSGKSFQVFRRCISQHLSYSPDLRVDIIDG